MSYFLTINPEHPKVTGSTPGNQMCTLTVTKLETVISEPIEAQHANDEAAIQWARADVARRLGVSIDEISY
jgi:hypothetical protein